MNWLRRCRVVPAAILLAATAAQATGAGAQMITCRTDPMVTLSNGYVVTMWADISTDISNVTSVNYVLHVPKGVTMQSISYDANGYLEHVQIVADQSGTHYSDSTIVYTTTAGVAVSAYATRQDSTVASKSGQSGTAITLNWCT